MKTKKYITITAILIGTAMIAGLLSACAGVTTVAETAKTVEKAVAESTDDSPTTENSNIPAEPIAVKTTNIDFSAQYIRTDGYHPEVNYPVVTVVRSAEELNAYYKANAEDYQFELNGFRDIRDKYNADYFRDRILILALLEEPSGSNRHRVNALKLYEDGKLTIHIERLVPEAGTCDMAEWHILIEPEKGFDIDDTAEINVMFGGIDATEIAERAYATNGKESISLDIPNGWVHEIKNDPDSGDFSISFWPIRQRDGSIRVSFEKNFGYCGTDLYVEDITLGKYQAQKCRYGEGDWAFIMFNKPVGNSRSDYNGSYVIVNFGASKWLNVYGDEATKILNSITIGDFPESIGDGEKSISSTISEDNFEFSFVWNTYGISSYDSANGRLVKTTDATHPEDYITTYTLSRQQKKEIAEALTKLNITSYPRDFDPYNAPNAEMRVASSPSRTLILTVKTDTMEKTIACKDICEFGKGYDEKAQKFLDFCAYLQGILTDTPEWKSLPEYEFLYQ